MSKRIQPLTEFMNKSQNVAKQKNGANSFEAVALVWLVLFASCCTKSHVNRIFNLLQRDVFPYIGRHPIRDITAHEVLAVLRRIESRTLDVAHRAKIVIGQIFRFAVQTGRAEHNPVENLPGALPPVKKNHYANRIDPKDIAPLLRAIDGYVGSIVVRCVMQLAPLVMVRPNELRQAEWGEIDFETEQWTISAEKRMIRAAHIVPLSSQAVAMASL